LRNEIGELNGNVKSASPAHNHKGRAGPGSNFSQRAANGNFDPGLRRDDRPKVAT